jgi:hypothetical protein
MRWQILRRHIEDGVPLTTLAAHSTVRSITTGLDSGMRTLAQQGTAAYRDTYELAWRHRVERPNAIWQADHTELDILVLDANLKPGHENQRTQHHHRRRH